MTSWLIPLAWFSAGALSVVALIGLRRAVAYIREIFELGRD